MVTAEDVLNNVYGGTLRSIIEDLKTQIDDWHSVLSDKQASVADINDANEHLTPLLPVIEKALSIYTEHMSVSTDEWGDFIKTHNLKITK